LPSVSKTKPWKPAPQKSPKTAKAWKNADELERLLADRAGEPAIRVSVFGNRDNWDASLLVAPVGNAERKARFKSIVSEQRREYDLSAK
jgi:hypothetical protein